MDSYGRKRQDFKKELLMTQTNREAVEQLGKKWGKDTVFDALKEGFRRQCGIDPHGLYNEYLVEVGKLLVLEDTLPVFMRTFIRVRA
jgi:hypothetical protein